MPQPSWPNPFITRVRLKNYRSFEACDVSLGPLAFLVGANGSGKSNFLDALRLITDALNTSLDHALRERGGIGEVRRRSSGHPTHFSVRLDFNLGEQQGSFAFEVAARPRGDFGIARELCHVGAHFYDVREGAVEKMSLEVRPPAMSDRLYLTNAAGLPEFRPLYDALTQMGFYSINPTVIRELQSADKGDVLARDGRNLASVIERMDREKNVEVLQRIKEYLGRVVPGLSGFAAKQISTKETIEFLQQVEGAEHPWRFPAINMSDGTLRALAVLVALFQSGSEHKIRLIGIEEPETALHPAAAGVLRDCIVEGAAHTQVLVTSHSAELLDSSDISVDSLFAVEANLGTTSLAPLNETTRSILRDRLYTAGELLRNNQLAQDSSKIARPEQLRLFDDAP
jgi:predicted ATPase